ncbi:Ig-like domain-containing protein, partial [Atopobacter phocae]|uniref:Ig-like domain-containing protein n=1 Tax=Atopobacter phocae TaxID=136492 RepID=UPI0012EC1578
MNKNNNEKNNEISQTIAHRKYTIGGVSFMLGCMALYNTPILADQITEKTPHVSLNEPINSETERDDQLAQYVKKMAVPQVDALTETDVNPSTDSFTNPSDETDELKQKTQVNSEKQQVKSNKNVSTELKQVNIAIEGLNTEEKDLTTVTPHTFKAQADVDDALKVKVALEVPDTVVEGDYFHIQLSNNIDVSGVSHQKANGIPELIFNERPIAYGEVFEGRNIIYRFTKEVEQYTDISAEIEFPAFINKYNVLKNSDQMIEVTIGEVKKNKTVAVDYSKKVAPHDVDSKAPIIYPNGSALIDNIDEENLTMEQTIFYNEKKNKLENGYIQIANENGSKILFNEDAKNTMKIYRLKEGKELAQSFAIKTSDVDELTSKDYKVEIYNGTMTIIIHHNDNAPYILKYQAAFEKRTDEEGTALNTSITFRSDNPKNSFERPWEYKNRIALFEPKASSEGENIELIPPISEKNILTVPKVTETPKIPEVE